MYINPDIDFIKEIGQKSGSSLKSCMQCGTCSVVCKLSPDDRPFPRKEMIWTAWGLKDKLYGNPDIWLCHQCGDCSDSCPRDAKPANVMAAIRQNSYQHYARPRFLGKWLGNAAYLPLVLAIPIIIITGILHLSGSTSFPKGDVNYSEFFPHMYLNLTFSILLLLTITGNMLGLRMFWLDMKRNAPGTIQTGMIKSLLSVLREVKSHKHFKSCTNDKSRAVAHALIFWGFILLLIVTAVAVVNVVLLNYPMEFWHPAKIAGNIAGLILVTGCVLMMIRRASAKGSNYFDWAFLIGVILLLISGGLTEMARFGNWGVAYYIYFFHLIMVWLILLFAPYTKFAHIIYRTTAMTYARMIGRNY